MPQQGKFWDSLLDYYSIQRAGTDLSIFNVNYAHAFLPSWFIPEDVKALVVFKKFGPVQIIVCTGVIKVYRAVLNEVKVLLWFLSFRRFWTAANVVNKFISDRWFQSFNMFPWINQYCQIWTRWELLFQVISKSRCVHAIHRFVQSAHVVLQYGWVI